jgi:hypothetical protein
LKYQNHRLWITAAFEPCLTKTGAMRPIKNIAPQFVMTTAGCKVKALIVMPRLQPVLSGLPPKKRDYER